MADLSQKQPFFERRAFLILMVIFFLVPSAMRGARMSLQNMKNNVKDWLPSNFQETKDLAWFGDHFMGERFIIATWPGCTADDEGYQKFVRALQAEVLPKAGDKPVVTFDDSGPELSEAQIAERTRAREVGDEHSLFVGSDLHENWGGLNERWLHGEGEKWYYITPDGTLYQWQGQSTLPAAIGRRLERWWSGPRPLQGEQVSQFQDPSAENNPFYENPELLSARLFGSIMTGPEVLAQLSEEGGPLWPIGADYNEEERRDTARRDSMERLTGSLFGKPVFDKFKWDVIDFQRIIREHDITGLPNDWKIRFTMFVSHTVRTKYGGDPEKLENAPYRERAEHWETLFATLGVEQPEPLTCLVLTLSEPGKNNLSRIIGRPVLGKQPGKLFQMAEYYASIGLEDLKLGGPPVDNIAVDEEGTITLARLIWFSCAVGIGLAYLCFRSIKVTIMVFFVGGVSAMASLSLVWFGNTSVDAIVMSMPSLVYVLGLSGAVHIINYYRDAVHETGLATAPGEALRHGFKPCTLAAFTTSLGLLSLCTSNILPIKKFGLFSALGVFLTLGLLFTYLPSALQVWNPGYHKLPTGKKKENRIQQYVSAFWRHALRMDPLSSRRCGCRIIDHDGGDRLWRHTNQYVGTASQALRLRFEDHS